MPLCDCHSIKIKKIAMAAHKITVTITVEFFKPIHTSFLPFLHPAEKTSPQDIFHDKHIIKATEREPARGNFQCKESLWALKATLRS